MADEPSKKPDPIEDVRKGLGLLFRAAKNAASELPTGKLEDALMTGVREVGRAVENVASTIEREVFGAKNAKTAQSAQSVEEENANARDATTPAPPEASAASAASTAPSEPTAPVPPVGASASVAENAPSVADGNGKADANANGNGNAANEPHQGAHVNVTAGDEKT